MTLENKILRDLKSWQSTPSAIALRLKAEEGVIKAMCNRMAIDGKIQIVPHRTLTIYTKRTEP